MRDHVGGTTSPAASSFASVYATEGPSSNTSARAKAEQIAGIQAPFHLGRLHKAHGQDTAINMRCSDQTSDARRLANATSLVHSQSPWTGLQQRPAPRRPTRARLEQNTAIQDISRRRHDHDAREAVSRDPKHREQRAEKKTRPPTCAQRDARRPRATLERRRVVRVSSHRTYPQPNQTGTNCLEVVSSEVQTGPKCMCVSGEYNPQCLAYPSRVSCL